MPGEKDASSSLIAGPGPALSRLEVLAIIIAVVIAVLFALPDLKKTHAGALLSGKCDRDPKPELCTPLPDPDGVGWFDVLPVMPAGR
jgi:hypothetical protein